MGLRCEKWREQALMLALVFLAFALVQCTNVDGEEKGELVDPEPTTRKMGPPLLPRWTDDSGSGQGSNPDGSWQYGWGWGTGSHENGPGFGFGGGSGDNGEGGGGGGGSGGGGGGLFHGGRTAEPKDGGGNN